MPEAIPVILVIDDDPFIRTSINYCLGSRGYTVIEAEDGEQGLILVENAHPDLIICDLRLPGIDGLDVLATASRQSPNTPVIIISGVGKLQDAIAALHLGACDYIVKPFKDMGLLLHAIEKTLERSRLIRENRAYRERLEEKVTARTRELQRLNAELQASEEKYRSIFENLQDVYYEICLNGMIVEVSPSVSAVSLYHREEIINTSIKTLYTDPAQGLLLLRKLKRGQTVADYEINLRDKNGSVKSCSITAQLRNGTGAGKKICGTLRDITERKQAEAHIAHLAYHDALTNLPNRRLLLNRLQQDLGAIKRRRAHGALLFLDLDHFKHINDALGHAFGDALLMQVAERLTQQLRAEDTVARLGGDEFIVVLSRLHQDPEIASFEARKVAEKIQTILSIPYRIEDQEHHITSSIGIALFAAETNNAEQALKQADTALYRAKEAGRNNIRFFSPSMQHAADKRLRLQTELRQALEHKHFQLHYQPQVDRNGHIVGVEALLRWRHPDRGMLSPDEFIAIAEESALINAIGSWVLSNAIEQFNELRTMDRPKQVSLDTLSVNVSPAQFHSCYFLPLIARALDNSGIPATALILEITEGLVMINTEEVIKKMIALKALGVRFAIDDFGTGYSSLTYLKRLPLDILKIDKSFVHDAVINPNAAAIVETIISMAKHLGLQVIAEGVETQQQYDFLHQKGCKFFQGYYFAPPVPVDSLHSSYSRAYDRPNDMPRPRLDVP